jgi:hypothetical protein
MKKGKEKEWGTFRRSISPFHTQRVTIGGTPPIRSSNSSDNLFSAGSDAQANKKKVPPFQEFLSADGGLPESESFSEVKKAQLSLGESDAAPADKPHKSARRMSKRSPNPMPFRNPSSNPRNTTSSSPTPNPISPHSNPTRGQGNLNLLSQIEPADDGDENLRCVLEEHKQDVIFRKNIKKLLKLSGKYTASLVTTSQQLSLLSQQLREISALSYLDGMIAPFVRSFGVEVRNTSSVISVALEAIRVCLSFRAFSFFSFRSFFSFCHRVMRVDCGLLPPFPLTLSQ